MTITNSGAVSLVEGKGALLRAENLAAARGDRVLFADLSFEAGPGDLVELRGANGSGKTTLLRTLSGLAKAHAGKVHIDQPEPETALHLVGHRDGLKSGMDARAHLRFWAGLLGGEESAIDGALKRLGLAPIARLAARALSQGQTRRLSLARLLVAPRPIWLLDEPAQSLDAEGRVLLGELIATHRASGGAVIVALHEALGPERMHAATHVVTLGAP